MDWPLPSERLFHAVLGPVAERRKFAVQPVGMGVFKQMGEYLFLRKKDPNRPKSDFINKMHGINRISIFMFLLCLLILAIKLIIR